MPTYDFRCRTCDTAFEVRRSVTASGPAACPHGHAETSRVFTPVATSRAGSRGSGPEPVSGGCCGGGCCG